MLYANLKNLHILCVALSGIGFVLRAYWHLCAHPLRHARWARVAPHVIDTLLLLSALALLVSAHIRPFEHPWLMAKIVLLLVYIALGMVAMRSQGPWAMRAAWFAAALGIYVAMITLAVTKRVPEFVLTALTHLG